MWPITPRNAFSKVEELPDARPGCVCTLGGAICFKGNRLSIITLCKYCGNASVFIRSQKEGRGQTGKESLWHESHSRCGTSLSSTGASSRWLGSLATWVDDLADASVTTLNLALAGEGLIEAVAGTLHITGRLEVEGTLDKAELGGGDPKRELVHEIKFVRL